jgi:Tfp pilus assembly protein PilZ
MLTAKKRWSERRKFRRLDFQAKAFLVYCNDKAPCTIRNISNTGAFVDTNRMYEKGDEIELLISFTKGTSELSLRIPGKIARIAGMGVGFTSPHMNINQILQLELMLDSNQENPKELVSAFCKFFAM